MSASTIDIFKKMLLAVGLTSGVLVLSACDYVQKTRVRLSATVRVDGKLYNGSSVQEYECHPDGGMWGNVNQCHAKGESVVVVVPSHATLFLLISGYDDSYTTMKILKARGQDPFSKAKPGLPTRWHVQGDNLPMMVTFEDINVPASVQEVDAGTFSETYGAGAELVGVTAELTEDPISFGEVYRVIPWIKSSRTLLDGKEIVTTNDISSNLDRTSFVLGDR